MDRKTGLERRDSAGREVRMNSDMKRRVFTYLSVFWTVVALVFWVASYAVREGWTLKLSSKPASASFLTSVQGALLWVVHQDKTPPNVLRGWTIDWPEVGRGVYSSSSGSINFHPIQWAAAGNPWGL